MITKPLGLCLAIALPMTLASCAPAASPSGGGSGSTGGAPGSGGSVSTGGTPGSGGVSTGSGGDSAGTGGSTGTGGSAGTGGSPASGEGGAGSGGSAGTGGVTGTPDAGGAPEAGGENVAAIAGTLDGAFLEPKCTDKPANGFCHHSGVIETKLKLGGEAGKTYDVTLNVWAIAEGLKFTGGEPAGDHFYAGGMSITPRYSPCGLKVGDKTYYLNRKEDRANDKVYKFQYTTPAIKIPGQADLLLYCVDDASKHISINNPPPLGNAANGRHTLENPPERLKAKLGMQPYAFTFIYLEVGSAKVAP